MTLGFTGTRRGLTAEQSESVLRLIHQLNPEQATHGCCEGADRDFHHLVSRVALHLRLRPFLTSQQRWAISQMPRPDGRIVVYEEDPDPLRRNRDIVNDSDVMIACPGTMTEVLRSGTWATIRYTRKTGKTLFICWPDGSVTREGREL